MSEVIDKWEQDRLNDMILSVKNLNKHELMSAINWMVLGDGSITKPLRGQSRLEISHTDHLDYLQWKKAIIENITGAEIKDRPPSKSVLAYSDKWSQRLRSKTHPVFSGLRERLYGVVGRKAIDIHALKILTPMGLAILYQDDGSYAYSDARGYKDQNVLIHTLAFGELENEALARIIVKATGLIFRVNRVKKRGKIKYRLRLRSKDIQKFFDWIYPYIVPSMLYKLGRGSEWEFNYDQNLNIAPI